MGKCGKWRGKSDSSPSLAAKARLADPETTPPPRTLSHSNSPKPSKKSCVLLPHPRIHAPTRLASAPESQLVPNPPALSRGRGQQRTLSPRPSPGPSQQRPPAKVERPQKLEKEAWQSCYLLGTLETEMAATATALFPHNICLSASDIETAAILLQANAWTDLRKGQTSFVLKVL